MKAITMDTEATAEEQQLRLKVATKINMMPSRREEKTS
jgi:hypothetical protein